MKNLFHLVQKNMKLLLRSKASALIVILGPLLVIFLAGLAFDNSKSYSISLGTFSGSYNELSEGFITTLEENDFKVTKYEDEESCIQSIREGTVHSCLSFSPDFTLSNQARNEIIFYVDYSKINLVYMVLDTLNSKISSKSEELSMSMTTVLIDTLDFAKSELESRNPDVESIQSQSSNASSKVLSASQRLNSMDVSTDLISGISTEDLVTLKNEISAGMSQVEGDAEDAIDEARSLIDNVESDIEASSLSQEEKDDILSLLNNSAEDLDEIETSLEDHTNSTSFSLAELESLVSEIEEGINDAKDKLEDAGSAKSSSLSSLSEASTQLSSAIENIATVKDSLAAVQNNINEVEVTDASSIVNPVSTTIKPVAAQATHLNYIFPVLIILVVMFTGILLSTTLIMLEKKTTAYFRNFISPTWDITFTSATFITCIMLLLVQIVVILGISAVFFGSKVFYSFPKALPILFMCMAFFTLAGMLVGYIFNSEETATLGAISVGSVFMMMSDLILPLESMSQSLFDIAQYNPFVLGSSLLRKALIHDVSFPAIENGLLYLFAYCIAIFALVLVIQAFTKKHYISRFLRNIAAKPEKYKKNK